MNTNGAQINDLARLLPGAMFSQRLDFTFSFVSSRIAEFTGLSASEWSGQPAERFWEIIHEADVEELRKQVHKANAATDVVTSTFRIRNLTTRQVKCIEERRQAVRAETGALLRYDCVWLNVTQQIESERLRAGVVGPEVLARLTDVWVHDFNNCMTGIHALCETIRFSIDPAHPFHESLDLMQQNANRAKEIIQRVIDFAYSTGTKAFHNLNDLATDGVELARKIASPRIRIESTLAPESLPIFAEAAECRKIIVKLIVNAINSMPQGGALRFETARHDKYPPLTHRCGDWPRLPSFCLAITHPGSGTTNESLSETFEAFSANQPLSQDQGTGLYALGEAIKRLRGAITVEYEQGKGRTFRIWLPEADFTESAAR
jgi:signal transduction histidine kinase